MDMMLHGVNPGESGSKMEAGHITPDRNPIISV
jgi:hypothetical protein